MFNIGPFSIHVALLLLAVLTSGLFAFLLARKSAKAIFSILTDGFLVGVLLARLAYVAFWLEDYIAQPWSILAIGDGGFYAWVGIVTGLLFIAWRAHKQAVALKPSLISALLAIALWFAGNLLVSNMQQATQLPNISFYNLQQQSVNLNDFAGKPLVINLWASWCPPCRREMPAFAKAQSQIPELSIVMLNQGEDAQTVATFLQQQQLAFQHVLLDAHSQTMSEFGASGLPTSLFFSADGKLFYAHMGEMTLPRMKDIVQSMRHAQPSH